MLKALFHFILFVTVYARDTLYTECNKDKDCDFNQYNVEQRCAKFTAEGYDVSWVCIFEFDCDTEEEFMSGITYTLECKDKHWMDYLIPSETWLYLFTTIEKAMNFITAVLEMCIGLLNVWIPELSSYFQAYQNPDS